jgi:hypothetical protein
VLQDALVEALVAPAQQRERRLGRELLHPGVVERPATRSERDDAAAVAQLHRIVA